MKRLRSDFLHVKADHKRAKPFNEARFGENATIFPFKDLNFEDFVEVFVKNEDKLNIESPIRGMIKQGRFALYYAESFKERPQVQI